MTNQWTNSQSLHKDTKNNGSNSQRHENITNRKIRISPAWNNDIRRNQKHHHHGESTTKRSPWENMLPGTWHFFFFFQEVQKTKNRIHRNRTSQNHDRNRREYQRKQRTPIHMKIHEHHTYQDEDETIRYKSKKSPIFLHHFFHLRTNLVSTIIPEHHRRRNCRNNTRNRQSIMIHELSQEKCRMSQRERKCDFEITIIADFLDDLREKYPNTCTNQDTKKYHAPQRNSSVQNREYITKRRLEWRYKRLIKIQMGRDSSCCCLRFHHTKHDEKKCYRCSIIEEAFSFEYQIQSAWNTELLEDTEHRRCISRRNQGTKKQRHDKRHFESEPTEYIPKKNTNNESGNNERNDCKCTHRTNISEEVFVPYRIGGFEEKNREKNIKKYIRCKLEIINKWKNPMSRNKCENHPERYQSNRRWYTPDARQIGNSWRENQEKNERCCSEKKLCHKNHQENIIHSIYIRLFPIGKGKWEKRWTFQDSLVIFWKFKKN